MATDIKNDATLGSGIVSAYIFDNSGNLGEDEIGTNTMSVTNSPVQSTFGPDSTSVDLELSSSQYMSISDGSQTGLEFNTDFSVSAWVKPESVPVSFAYGVCTKWGAGSSNQSMQIYMDAQPYFVFQIRGGSNTYLETSSFTYSAGNTYHICATADISAGTYRLYVNGAERVSTTSGTTSVNNTSKPVMIGNRDDLNYDFDGEIAQVVIWNKELSSSDVTDLYNSGSGIPYDAGGGGGGATFTPKVTMF